MLHNMVSRVFENIFNEFLIGPDRRGLGGSSVVVEQKSFGRAISHCSLGGHFRDGRQINRKSAVEERAIQAFQALSRCERVRVIVSNNYVSHGVFRRLAHGKELSPLQRER